MRTVVMTDAEDFEIAQPEPSKEISLMISPSSLICTVKWSPHRGLKPSTLLSASGSFLKLRGFLL